MERSWERNTIQLGPHSFCPVDSCPLCSRGRFRCLAWWDFVALDSGAAVFSCLSCTFSSNVQTKMATLCFVPASIIFINIYIYISTWMLIFFFYICVKKSLLWRSIRHVHRISCQWCLWSLWPCLQLLWKRSQCFYGQWIVSFFLTKSNTKII